MEFHKLLRKEVGMLSKTMFRFVVSVLGVVFVLSLCIGLSGAIAEEDGDPCDGQGPDCIYGCPDDAEFTSEFRLEDCKFKTTGANPYFILKPGYRLVLENDEEKSVETVLCETKTIALENGRRIKTRVLEERAWEEGKLVEISLNWFAICKKTNAVYYFGEHSRDCPAGFDENDVCTGTGGCDGNGECLEGSWEAGVDGAMPGLMMPGTALRGSRYFQEIAEEQEAVDRGEIVDLGLDVDVPAGEWEGCIEIHDTNPTEANPDNQEEDGCYGPNDVKLYCPRVGLVQDQELELVWRGFAGCNDGDDNHDDDDHRKWWK
jgi:hypothetical protein